MIVISGIMIISPAYWSHTIKRFRSLLSHYDYSGNDNGNGGGGNIDGNGLFQTIQLK